MSFAVVSEIRRVRNSVSHVPAHERRLLIRRIVEALEIIVDADTTRQLVPDCAGIELVILSTSRAVGEIAALEDEKFAVLITEFDLLFAKLSETALTHLAPASFEVHEGSECGAVVGKDSKPALN